MTYYPMDDYRLLGFELSKRKKKKYDAILFHKDKKKVVRVPFGDTRYAHYRDSTMLNYFSHLDHLDENRKMRYITRHRRWVLDGYYSPSYFSMSYLWT